MRFQSVRKSKSDSLLLTQTLSVSISRSYCFELDFKEISYLVVLNIETVELIMTEWWNGGMVNEIQMLIVNRIELWTANLAPYKEFPPLNGPNNSTI